MRLTALQSWGLRASPLRVGRARMATWHTPRPLSSTLQPRSRGRTLVPCAKKGNEEPKVFPKEIFDLAERMAGAAGVQPPPPRRQPSQRGTGNGVYALLLINFGLFLAQQFYPQYIGMLALSHWAPKWWQFVTAAFVHANWEHLSSNAFSLLIFGRIVEEEEGALGVWMTYLLCGIGGSVASYLTSPHTRTASLGASAAVFGLFAVGVLTKFKPSLRRLLEALILGQFVVKQVLNEVQMVTGGRALTLGGMQVGHVAHLAGAACGVALVLLLSRLPEVGDS